MKNFIVLDTETCGGMAKPLVYDLGYTIADNVGEVIKTRSYVIKETFDNECLFNTAYYKDKRPLYLERLETKYSKLIKLKYALIQLLKDIKRYEVETLYAYNSRFDVRAIMSSVERFGLKSNPATEIADIMELIGGITDTEDYQNFCEENGFMTKHKKPKPQKKAETLYRYLTNNPDYEEEHTALEDSKIELAILMEALKNETAS